MNSNVIYGVVGVIAGLIMFGIGTFKLKVDEGGNSKHRNLWKVKGQIGGIIFIILGVMAMFGFFQKLLGV